MVDAFEGIDGAVRYLAFHWHRTPVVEADDKICARIASLLSPQNSPGAGATSNSGMSRGGTSAKSMSRSVALTLSSCRVLASDRRAVSTFRLATKTADATTASARSCSVGSRCSPTQGKRCGSITCNMISRTRAAIAGSRLRACADSVVSASVFKSSSETGGAAKYRKAVRMSSSPTNRTICAGSSGSPPAI